MSFSDASDSVADLVLPNYYTEVQPCILPRGNIQIPETNVVINLPVVRDLCSGEQKWLDAVCKSTDSNDCSDVQNLSWAAFHAQHDSSTAAELPIIALLPLLRYAANTAAMIKHTMLIIQKSVHFLNVNQVPVIFYDQPLYALAKQVQWQWPGMFGETRFVIMMGGLHVEMACLRMLGHWLEGSGWVQCLVVSGMTTSGVADSFIHASNVKRTWYAHCVTAAALFICLNRLFNQYCEQTATEDRKSFSEWRTDCDNGSAQFKYWSTVLDLELLVLSFVRSVRTKDFHLYVETLKALIPWFLF